MSKILKIFILISLSILLSFCGKVITEEEARIALAEHLEKTYGEPFYIGSMGKSEIRGEPYYQASIYPMRYFNTDKAQDRYYHRYGNVNLKKSIFGEKIKFTGDTYGLVYCNESLNEYFTPKLEELFGKNFLPIMNLDTAYLADNNHFLDTIKLIRGMGGVWKIQGGIYIFHEINDLEEKDRIREKIFDFVTYMKEKNLFEYVDITFYIIDPRSLTDGFQNDVGNRLVEARETIKTANEFIEYRKELMSTLDKEFNQMNQEKILRRINSLNKSIMQDILGRKDERYKLNKYSTIYHQATTSEKIIEGDARLKKLKIRKYRTIDEIKLLNTMKADYKEYNLQELYDNTWEGE